MKKIKRLEELKNEQNNFHQQQILDEVIVWDGVEIAVWMVIYNMELIIKELNEQNRESSEHIVWLAKKFEQHDRLLHLIKRVLDNKRINI